MDMRLPPVLTDGDLDRALSTCLDADPPRDLAARAMARIAAHERKARPYGVAWRWTTALAASGAIAAAMLFFAVTSRVSVERPALPPAPALLPAARAVSLAPVDEQTLVAPGVSHAVRRTQPVSRDTGGAVPVLDALDTLPPIVVARLDTSPIGSDSVTIAPLTVDPLRVESLDDR